MQRVHSMDFDLAYSSLSLPLDNNYNQAVTRVVDGVLSAKPTSWKPLQVHIDEKGRKGLGDFTFFHTLPAFSTHAVATLRDLLVPHGQLLPINLGKTEWFVFNTTTVIDALDFGKGKMRRGEEIYWGDKQVFREEKLAGATIFKIPEMLSYGFPYVTDAFIERVAKAKLRGFRFKLLWSSAGIKREKYVPPKRLPTFPELQDALKKKYQADGLPELLLKKNDAARAKRLLTALERKLETKLPKAYQRAWQHYALSSWGCIAGFWKLSEVWRDNFQADYPWWGDGKQPQGLLVIGQTDPYTLLLHLKTGRVLAMDEDTPLHKLLPVAADFEKLILGLGTLEVFQQDGRSNRRLADDVARWVGGSKGKAFWREHATQA